MSRQPVSRSRMVSRMSTTSVAAPEVGSKPACRSCRSNLGGDAGGPARRDDGRQGGVRAGRSARLRAGDGRRKVARGARRAVRGKRASAHAARPAGASLTRRRGRGRRWPSRGPLSRSLPPSRRAGAQSAHRLAVSLDEARRALEEQVRRGFDFACEHSSSARCAVCALRASEVSVPPGRRVHQVEARQETFENGSGICAGA